MGKLEWHFGGRSSSRRSTADHSRRRHRPSLPSCMSTLFHFFDFRSSRFTCIVFDNRYPSSFDLSPHHPSLPKASHHGVEAPRNSLELDGASISCLRIKEENLQLQMGLQIKTRNGSTKPKASEQQLPNNGHIIALESPSAKTPNLLARLMGLDILPQTSSPSSNSRGPNFGTRSLPESPRISSARLSDVDYHHHRLSLQIIPEKENIEICTEEIKREKEKMRRKVALVDITNNNKKTEFGKQKVGFSQSKVEIKCTQKLKKMVANESSSSKIVLRNQEVMVSKKQKLISMSMQKPKPKAREGETFDCPTSNNLLNNLNHSTIFGVKKEPSPPATKVPREQPCRYSKGKAKPAGRDGGERNALNLTTTTDGGSAEFKYIKRILTNHHNLNSIISPSNNPMNPSIFHHLETAAAVENQQWNKRLLNCWHVRRGMKRWELGEEVRERVKKEYFPRVKYEVVENMDTLIINKRMAEEIEGIVKVVELHILDSLLRETIALISSLPKCSHFHNF